MNILAWVLGVVAAIILLAVFLWRSVNRNQVAKKQSNVMTGAPVEEFSVELSGDIFKPLSKPGLEWHSPEIPRGYGTDRLVLMVRDPNWLFAYWEITAAKQEEFNKQFGESAWRESRPVLRVYDVTGINFNGSNHKHYMDFPINDFVDNWHIEVSRPDSTLFVDLGRVFPDGRFVTLLRSNIVHTPRMEVSSLYDEEWMWIEGIYRTITRLHPGSSPLVIAEVDRRMGLVPLGISSPEFASGNKE